MLRRASTAAEDNARTRRKMLDVVVLTVQSWTYVFQNSRQIAPLRDLYDYLYSGKVRHGSETRPKIEIERAQRSI